MISRLLLVGMVGVLGISLPDGAETGWNLTWARAGATACACRRATKVVFEPIAVAEGSTSIADELNRLSDGTNLPITTAAPTTTPARPVAIEPADAVAKLFAENSVWASPAEKTDAPAGAVAKLFAENDVWAGSADRAETPADVVGQIFADNNVWAGPIEPTDVVDRLFAENDVWAGAAEAVASAEAPARKAGPTFEPIAVVDGGSSVADELNRDADGLAIAPAAEPTIGTAMKLTHDAALAWLNILTKTMPSEEAER